MKSIVAVEICPDAIRAAEILKPLSKAPKISKIGEIVIPGGVTGESQVLHMGMLTEALKQLWKNEKFSSKDVVLVVSGRRFIARTHETAHTSMDSLKKVLSFEASAVVPEGMNNPVIDFFPMFNSEAKGGVKTSGLVIATPSEPIELIIGALTAANLRVSFVDFAPMAIARFIKNNVNPEEYGLGYAVANIREKSTDILVAKGDIPRMIRVAPVGLTPKETAFGRHFVEDDEDQEQIVGPDGSINSSPIEALAREIKISVTSQIESLGIMIDQLYVTGPRSDARTIAKLSEILGMKVSALSASDVKSVDELDEQLMASDFVAVCAGMRGKA